MPFFWSLVFPLSKIILRDVPPLSLVALRYLMGAMFILGFTAVAANASQVVGLHYETGGRVEAAQSGPPSCSSAP